MLPNIRNAGFLAQNIGQSTHRWRWVQRSFTPTVAYTRSWRTAVVDPWLHQQTENDSGVIFEAETEKVFLLPECDYSGEFTVTAENVECAIGVTTMIEDVAISREQL